MFWLVINKQTIICAAIIGAWLKYRHNHERNLFRIYRIDEDKQFLKWVVI